MKAKIIVPTKGKLPDTLLDRPLGVQDPPEPLPEITQAEIVEFATALHIFRLARGSFEAKRAALTMKLLRSCHCEEGDYFALLTEHGELVVEDRTSLEMGTGRPILDRDCVPSGGAA
jgi:hypothetical protein